MSDSDKMQFLTLNTMFFEFIGVFFLEVVTQVKQSAMQISLKSAIWTHSLIKTTKKEGWKAF